MNRIVFIVINLFLYVGLQSSTAITAADFNKPSIIIGSKGDINKQFNKENAVYVIRKRIDLNASTLIIPSGSILLFKGGRFYNGTVIGTDTEIRNKKNKRIFGDNISLGGAWLNEAVYDVWFGGGTFKSIVQNMLSIGRVLHFYRDYTNETINTPILISRSVEMDFHNHTLNVKSRNIANNPDWGCWIFDSEYIKDKNERRNVTIRNLRISSTADNYLKNTRFDGNYSGLNLLLCRDLDTVKIDNVRTRDIDYCARVGGEYGEKRKNVYFTEVTNCFFDRSVMPLFFKNIEKVRVNNTKFNNENQNSSLLHCIYVYEGVDDMLVESCQFENSLSAVNFGTTANPSNPIGTVVFKDCRFNCATNGAGSVGSWHTGFSDHLYFEECSITNQSYSINGNASFKNCYISGTILYHYHFIHGASFENCIFDMKLGVDNQYGIVTGELDMCKFNIDCNGHSIYYWFDSHSDNKGTIISNSTFDFSNTRGDLFLCGSEKPYSEIVIKNVTINYPQSETNIKRYIRLLGRSKVIETKGQISIDGLYLYSSDLSNYTDDVNYSKMIKFDCQNIFSNGEKQKGVNFKSANVQNK